MEGNQKESDYMAYCVICKHFCTPETEDPCNECLTQPFNYDTHKPIKYEGE